MMNNTILVTGGSKGIGLAILKRFAKEGFHLITCARNQTGLDKAVSEIKETFPGISMDIYQADLSDRMQVNDFIAFVKGLNISPTILVNNAGVFIPGKVHEEEEGMLEKVIQTNLYSAYHITRAFVPEMKARKSGHIFNMCSTASIIPYVNGGSYCISKFAMLGMNKVLREELKEDNVRVTAILPGATFTASWEGVDIPPERFMKAEDVAVSVYNAWKLSENSVVEEVLIRPQLGDL